MGMRGCGGRITGWPRVAVGPVLTFMREFVRDPVCLGAVAPSGRELASLTVASAEIRAGHVVVELGAGTGPMTSEIVANHPDNAFLALEPKAALAAALRARFPDVLVDERYCQSLPEICEEWGHPRVDRVVSSLPWAIWPDDVQQTAFEGIARVMQPDARMVTFTYAHSQVLPAAKRFRQTLERQFVTVTKTRIAWFNVPPAFVFVCDQPRPGKH